MIESGKFIELIEWMYNTVSPVRRWNVISLHKQFMENGSIRGHLAFHSLIRLETRADKHEAGINYREVISFWKVSL